MEPRAVKPRYRRTAPATVTLAVLIAGCVLAATPSRAETSADAHAGHAVRLSPAVTRSTAHYATPAVTLTRADGRQVSLVDELDDGRPVVLNFVYTTCTTICSLGSQTFAELEKTLGPGRDRVHLVSVSIDPDEDTPQRLSAYSRRFDAGPQWSFYTGTLDASRDVQRAFRVYRGSKADHSPVTLVRVAPGRAWVRLDGFATVAEILAELNGAAAVN
jgi:protein SCO1/2